MHYYCEIVGLLARSLHQEGGRMPWNSYGLGPGLQLQM